MGQKHDRQENGDNVVDVRHTIQHQYQRNHADDQHDDVGEAESQDQIQNAL